MSSELSQYLPGTAGLVDQLDQRLLLVLHDGRHLIGTLRTFDQYLNLVLEDTIERVIFEGRWSMWDHFSSFKRNLTPSHQTSFAIYLWDFSSFVATTLSYSVKSITKRKMPCPFNGWRKRCWWVKSPLESRRIHWNGTPSNTLVSAILYILYDPFGIVERNQNRADCGTTNQNKNYKSRLKSTTKISAK